MHSANLKTSGRLQKVQALLADGQERSTREIMLQADVCAVSAVVSELRANGLEVTCRRAVDPNTRGRIWLYRLVATGTRAGAATDAQHRGH